MAMQPGDWRDQPFSEQERRSLYRLSGGFFLVLLGVLIGWVLFGGAEPRVNDDYLTNLFTEGASIFLTVIVLNRLARERDASRQLAERKERLLREAGSSVANVARSAIEELRYLEWTDDEDSLLQGANMRKANLSSVDLKDANLRGAVLRGASLQHALLDQANLEGAQLIGADISHASVFKTRLQGADMRYANLTNAKLKQTDLRNVDLQSANLEDANLRRANLRGANLSKANLQDAAMMDAVLIDALFSEKTTLPDGTKWTPETDLTRFGAIMSDDE